MVDFLRGEQTITNLTLSSIQRHRLKSKDDLLEEAMILVQYNKALADQRKAYAKVNSLKGLIGAHKQLIDSVKKTGRAVDYNKITIDSLNRDIRKMEMLDPELSLRSPDEFEGEGDDTGE